MSDAGGAGFGPVGAFIRSAISEGLGVTAARNAMREAGIGRMNNTTFGQIYGQIRDTIGARSAIAALDYSVLPPAGAYSEWAAGTSGRYASFVDVHVREIGSQQTGRKWFQHVTDFPHTPQEAIDAAMASVMGGTETGLTPSGEVIIGATITSLTRTVARAS